MFPFAQVLIVRTDTDLADYTPLSTWKDNVKMRLFYLIPVYQYSNVIIAHYCNNKWTFFDTKAYQSL